MLKREARVRACVHACHKLKPSTDQAPRTCIAHELLAMRSQATRWGQILHQILWDNPRTLVTAAAATAAAAAAAAAAPGAAATPPLGTSTCIPKARSLCGQLCGASSLPEAGPEPTPRLSPNRRHRSSRRKTPKPGGRDQKTCIITKISRTCW